MICDTIGSIGVFEVMCNEKAEDIRCFFQRIKKE